MNDFDKKALTETIEVLNHSDAKIVEKISEKFKNFLKENMDTDYKPNINFSNENWDEEILDDTKAILALIYRDYIVSEEERMELIKEEEQERIRQEEELREKYNPDIFLKKQEHKKEREEVINNEVAMIEYRESIFKRFINKIKSIFNIK